MRRLAVLVPGLLAILPYLGAISFPLLYDDRTLLDNRWLVREAGPVSVFEHDYWYGTRHEASDLYRPLTILSLAENMRLAPSRQGMRSVNVAFHAIAALAVAWMLSRIVSARAAWIGASIFALHPLASESVLWAVGRAEIGSAIFGVIAFVLFTKLDGDRAVDRRLTGSALAFLAALGFKESAVAWLAIGACWYALAGPRPRWEPRLVAIRAAWYAGALAVFLALRASAVGWERRPVPLVDNPLAHVDPATRAVNALLLLVRYAGKMIWPRTLSIEYGYDAIGVVPVFPWGALGASAVAVAVATAVIVLSRRGKRQAAFLVALVPCAFAVTGNFLFPIGTIFGERLAYTPLIGACGLAGWAIASIRRDIVTALVFAALAVAGGWRTAVRAGDYRDLATLSEATVEASPRSVRALSNAARTRMRQGRPADAIPLLERSLAIWPDDPRAKALLQEARGGSPPPTTDDESR